MKRKKTSRKTRRSTKARRSTRSVRSAPAQRAGLPPTQWDTATGCLLFWATPNGDVRGAWVPKKANAFAPSPDMSEDEIIKTVVRNLVPPGLVEKRVVADILYNCTIKYASKKLRPRHRNLSALFQNLPLYVHPVRSEAWKLCISICTHVLSFINRTWNDRIRSARLIESGIPVNEELPSRVDLRSLL